MGLAAALISIGSRVRADAPALVPVRGYLTDADGTPETGNHRLTFFLYAEATGGTPLYTDDYASIDVEAGNFIVYLGSGDDALDLAIFRDASELWLEIVIDGDETISPRLQLGSVAYAGYAQYCGEAAGLSSAAADALLTDTSFKGTTTFEAATFNARATFDDGFRFDGRVVKGPAMTGDAFFAQTVTNGANVCSAGFHPCTAWEAMVIDTVSTGVVFDERGWVVGSFPNIDGHMRSLVNGQDSTVCPVGSLLSKFPSSFAHGNITTPGGLHCIVATQEQPVWCCRNKS